MVRLVVCLFESRRTSEVEARAKPLAPTDTPYLTFTSHSGTHSSCPFGKDSRYIVHASPMVYNRVSKHLCFRIDSTDSTKLKSGTASMEYVQHFSNPKADTFATACTPIRKSTQILPSFYPWKSMTITMLSEVEDIPSH